MSFLKAGWRKLALANYEVEPELLAPLVPYQTELDSWQGRYYVSLVGFLFVDTRLLGGVKVPFHVNFEEVNLRFYVRYKEDGEWKRGVVFVKEIVPKWAITAVANTLYREHYATRKMRHLWREDEAERYVSYGWREKGQWQHFGVKAALTSQQIAVGSEAEFITEHYWGYTQIHPQKTFEYQVTHPRWEVYPVHAHEIDVDFGLVYGERFSLLNEMEPTSVMLAEGSEITVEGRRRV